MLRPRLAALWLDEVSRTLYTRLYSGVSAEVDEHQDGALELQSMMQTGVEGRTRSYIADM